MERSPVNLQPLEPEAYANEEKRIMRKFVAGEPLEEFEKNFLRINPLFVESGFTGSKPDRRKAAIYLIRSFRQDAQEVLTFECGRTRKPSSKKRKRGKKSERTRARLNKEKRNSVGMHIINISY